MAGAKRRELQAAGDALAAVYGTPSAELTAAPADALQVSPLVPGSTAFESLAPASLSEAVIAAPAGTLERRRVLALALRGLAPGARLTVLAPKDRGGTRLVRELAAFGCKVEESARRHQRICHTVRPDVPVGLEAAIEAAAPRWVEAEGGGFWTEAGVFSWDRPDPGSALLVQTLPALTGHGFDLGCGPGLLARAVLKSPRVKRLDLIDIDRRAVALAERNIDDPRARFLWADVREPLDFPPADFVVMNPPFHHEGVEDRELGEAFIRRAATLLRKGGVLWVVANRHLPYEAALNTAFTSSNRRAEAGGYKVYEAVR